MTARSGSGMPARSGRSPSLPHASIVYAVAFSPDGSRLAAGCADNSIRLWDVATRYEVAELRGHRAYVHALAFSPDGTRLVSASGDYTLRVWDTLPPQELRHGAAMKHRTAANPRRARASSSGRLRRMNGGTPWPQGQGGERNVLNWSHSWRIPRCCVVDRIDSISLIGPSFVVRRYLGHWSLNKSHHFDTPTAREDPRINLCDFYLFRGHPGTTVIALTMNPDAGMSAPEAFRDEGLTFRFDLDNDAREEVTFKVKLGPVSHSDGDERRHVQTFKVLRATGESALRGEEGDLIASGQTGETATTPDGVSAFAGLSPDIFAGDAASFEAFRAAFIKEGRFDPTALQNRKN